MGKPLPFLPQFEEDRLFVGKTDRHNWVESSLNPSSSSHDFLGTSVTQKKMALLFFCLSFVLGVLFIRTAYLQIIEGGHFSNLARQNKIKNQIIPSKRGVIMDRSGVMIARNEANFGIQVIPAELPNEERARSDIFEKLASVLGLPEDEIRAEVAHAPLYQPLLLAEHLSSPQAILLDVASSDMPGVSVSVSPGRQYDIEGVESLSHVVGFLGRINSTELKEKQGYTLNDTLGKEGVELSYEHLLRGTFGMRRLEVDALGNERRVLAENAPIDGSDLFLTIDKELQKKTEAVLKKWMKTVNAQRAAVLISDPTTGDLLSVVSLPTYDNTIFSRGISRQEYERLLSDKNEPLFARALRGTYPSGSTIKPIVAAAALQEGVISEQTRFFSQGGIRIGEWFFPDWKQGGHGATNVVKALAESVNTFFYIVGGGYENHKGLGVQRLTSYFSRFGISEKTGIDLPGEGVGFIPTPEWKKRTKGEPWYVGDTYHIAIGQGDILVTPLTIHAMTAYFANGGENVRPRIVKEVLSPQGTIIRPSPQGWKKGLVRDTVVEIVRRGMRQTVLTGSGRRLASLGVSAAGKTGTAQWHPGRPPHAWFTGWAPYEKPEIVVTVLIEEGVEGSVSALLTTKEIMEWYFQERRGG